MSEAASGAAPATQAFLGLGSNLGDREALLRAAVAELDAADGVRIVAKSSLYETPPWGPVPQGPYLNLCVGIETALSASELLELCLAIERVHGRERLVRWGPRTLDIDLLVYGEARIDEPKLVVPHPRMLERAFVLVPLAEIAGDRVVKGRRIRQWAEDVDTSEIRLFGPA